MKRQFLISILTLAILIPSKLMAQPPRPQEGFRWMLNEEFSDEFNGDKLDLEKWYDYHPYWVGRPPAIFLPSQVSVKDGLLQIKNKKLEKDTVVTFWNGSTATYSIAGGAVVSRTRGAHYGYYECSQKASKIRMSTTFWMTSGSYAGPDPCSKDKYSQELDIQESVGGGAFANRTRMGSNSHFNYTNCDGVKTNYSAGTHIDLEEGVEVSDTFHVLAAHWKNANKADFYLNGKYGNSITFRTDILDKPFSNPMQINMVTETYDWVTPPADEDLADDERNTTYIDWVRSWKLVEVDYQEENDGNLVKNGGFESGDFSNWSGWGGNPREVVSDNVYSGNYAVHIGGPGAPEYELNLRSFATYRLSCYGKVTEGSDPIHFAIKDPNDNVLGAVDVSETSYTRKSFTFTTGSSAARLKFYFYAPSAGVEGYADDFELILEDAESEPEVEIPIFHEGLSFQFRPSVLPANLPIEIPLAYQANGDRQIHLQLRDRDSLLIEEKIFPALAGYGVKRLIMELDPLPVAGEAYMLMADLRHADSATADPEKSDIIILALRNPVEVSVKVVDLRDMLPMEEVSIRIDEKELLTSSEGLAIFEELPAGAYSVSLEKEGYESKVLTGLEAVKDTLIEIILHPLSYRVKLLVSDKITGVYIDGAMVSLGDSLGETKLRGKVSFLAHAGEYLLKVQAPRYREYEETLKVDGDAEFDILLHSSLANVKFVVQKDGTYLQNGTVNIGNLTGSTSTNGIVNFSDLSTDTLYSYSVSIDEWILLEDSLQLRTDSTIRVNIVTMGEDVNGSQESISLYPNPADDRIYVRGLESGQPYSILNIMGQNLKQGKLKKERHIDISELEPGFYLLGVAGQAPLRFVKE